MWPFDKENTQRAFGAIASILGLFLTGIGLNVPDTKIFGVQMLGIGFVIFLIGLFYLIEVTFK